MRKFLKTAASAALWLLLLTPWLDCGAFAQELLVGGQVVGVQISTRGVLVAEISKVETAEGVCSPAGDAGLRRGDIIVKAGGAEIKKAAQIIELTEACGGEPLCLTVQRGGIARDYSVTPVCSAEGQWMLGMWLRDGISGIGTMTFMEPESGIYGALGHAVSDAETGRRLPVSEGSITDAQIVGVLPGTAGKPGELSGCADLGRVLGSIERNTDCGVFGQTYLELTGRRMESGVITAGPATIISTLNGRESGEYDVEINRVYNESDGVHAMLSVVDAELISKTGGIVQGMSGSPIIQNNRIVGAVTHVFVSDPTRGYAVSIQDMLKAAGIVEKAA